MDINDFKNNVLEIVDPDNNDFMENYVNFSSYTLNNFSDSNITKCNSFNLFHHNARSILTEGRLEEYNIMLNEIDNPFHLLAFTESWLKTDNVDLVHFEGYESFHLTRQENNLKETGGGISVFIKEGINFKIRNDLNVMLPYVEVLFVEVNYDDKNYMVGIVYRVPNTKVADFVTKINELIEPIRNNFELILTGDFNICLLRDNLQATTFENCMMSNNLIPTILEATRVANVSRNGEIVLCETLIDNFFINTQHSPFCKSGLIQSSISDHYPVFLSIPCNSSNQNSDPFIVNYRKINSESITKFRLDYNAMFLDMLLEVDDAPRAFELFHTQFQKLYDKNFPVQCKTITRKSMLKPWVTSALSKKIKIRDNLCLLAKKGRVDRQVYKDFRNLLNKELKNAKALYHSKKFQNSNGNIKKTWDIINKSIKSRNFRSKIVLVENQNIVNDFDIPNKFVNHFSNVANIVDGNRPDMNNVKKYLQNRQINTFYLSKITHKEIENAIEQLKDNGCGLYNFSTDLLIGIKSDLSPILVKLFNLCTDQGYFPEELKTGCITPIHKKGDKAEISNYRPVCSLSPFSKIFERIIYSRMLSFINKYDLFSNTQHGFRPNLSTESALLKFIDTVHKGLTLKQNVGTIFMDLSKAFDVMNHDVLETKLEHYGFRGTFLKILMSFIRNRKYFVNVNGLNSCTKVVNIGVPQGSTIGPMFFLIFVNDMKACTILLELIQFADDTTLIFSCKNFTELKNTLESEVIKVIEWLETNKLILNLSKTHFMLFSFKRNIPKLPVMINGTELEEKTVTNFLGVQVDNKLTWKAHISHICSKVTKSIAILRLVRSTFPKRILKMIYMSLVYTYIDYCNLIWGSADPYNIKPLFILQKKAIRIINLTGYLEHTEPLFKKSKLLTVYQVFDLKCSIFMYKCLKCSMYPELKLKIKLNSDVHGHDTRRKTLRVIKTARIDICKKSFLYHGVDVWNQLDPEIKLLNSIGYFKKKLKLYFIGLLNNG